MPVSRPVAIAFPLLSVTAWVARFVRGLPLTADLELRLTGAPLPGSVRVPRVYLNVPTASRSPVTIPSRPSLAGFNGGAACAGFSNAPRAGNAAPGSFPEGAGQGLQQTGRRAEGTFQEGAGVPAADRGGHPGSFPEGSRGGEGGTRDCGVCDYAAGSAGLRWRESGVLLTSLRVKGLGSRGGPHGGMTWSGGSGKRSPE